MSGRPSKYRLRRRTDGIWEIVWRDPETGKRIRKSCSTRTEAVAARKLSLLFSSGTFDVPIDVRIGFLLDLYLHHLKRKYTIKTTVPYESKVARLKGFLGPLEWQEFSQLDVENYIDHARTLTAWNQKRRSLSDGTIIKDLQVLRAALRHAHLNRIVPYECRIEIRGLVAGTRTDWITQEQMRRVLRRCYTRPDRLHVLGFLLIGLCSAARREAILSLKWEQVRIPEAGWRSLSQLTALAPSPPKQAHSHTQRRKFPKI